MAGMNDLLQGFQVGAQIGNNALDNVYKMKTLEQSKQKLALETYNQQVENAQKNVTLLTQQQKGILDYAKQLQETGQPISQEEQSYLANQMIQNRQQINQYNKILAQNAALQQQGIGLMKNVKMTSDSEGNTKVSTDAATAMALRTNPTTASTASQFFRTPEEVAAQSIQAGNPASTIAAMSQAGQEDRLAKQNELHQKSAYQQAQTGLAQAQTANIPQQAAIAQQNLELNRQKLQQTGDIAQQRLAFDRQKEGLGDPMSMFGGQVNTAKQQAEQIGLPTDVPDVFQRVSNPQERQKLIAKSIEEGQKTLATGAKEVSDNATIMDNLNLFSQAMAKTPTGDSILLKTGLGRAAKTAFNPDMAQMEAITNILTPKFRQGLPGAASDADVAMFRGATVSIDKPVEANQRIIDSAKVAYQNLLDKQAFQEQYLATYGHLQGADVKWREYLDKNRIYAPDASQNPSDPNYMKLNPDRIPWQQYFQKKNDLTGEVGQSNSLQQQEVASNVPHGTIEKKTKLFQEKLPEGLKPYANDFVQAGLKNGIDPNLLASISAHETGNGTSRAFKQGQNAMGISDRNGVIDYSDKGGVSGSIDRMARVIATSPAYAKFRETGNLEDLASVYAPVGAENDPRGLNKDWLGGVLNRLRAFQSGQTLGWGDELSGVAAGLGAKLAGKDFGQAYQAEKKLSSAELDQFRKEHPYQSTGLELAGAFAMPMGAISKGTKIATSAVSKVPVIGRALATLPESIRTGALIGGAAGAGSAEENRTAGAITGAGFGSLAGGVGEVASRGISAAFSPNKVASIVEGKLGKSIDEIRNVLADESSPLTLADVSENMRGLGRTIRKSGGEAQETMTNFLKGRAEGESMRIADQSARLLSGKNYFNNVDDIINYYRPLTQEAYDKAMANEKVLKSDTFSQLFDKSPTMQKALDGAYKKAADDLVELPSKESMQKGGITTRVADYIKKSLDDMISEKNAYGQMTPEARQAQVLKTKFLNEVDKLNPEYAQARGIAADKAGLLEAQKFGYEARTKKPEEIQKYLSELSDLEKEAAKVGIANRIIMESEKTTDMGSGAKSIIGTLYKREQLKPFFRNESDYNIFIKSLKNEIEANATLNKVLQGSQTDINAAEGEQTGRAFARGAFYGVRGLAISGYEALVRKLEGITPENASKIANILTDRKASLELLDVIERSKVNPTQKESLINYMKKRIPALSAQFTGGTMGGFIGK